MVYYHKGGMGYYHRHRNGNTSKVWEFNIEPTPILTR